MSGCGDSVSCPVCGGAADLWEDYKVPDGKGGVYHQEWYILDCVNCGLYESNHPDDDCRFFREIEDLNELRELSELGPIDNDDLATNRKGTFLGMSEEEFRAYNGNYNISFRA